MGEVWPTAHITELCLQLTAGSRPVDGDEHRTLRSQSCETTGTLPFTLRIIVYYLAVGIYSIYTSQKKLGQCYFLNNSVKHWPI